MNAFKAIEASVADALGDHANSGVRASQAHVECAVNQALKHMKTRTWYHCRDLMRNLSADEVMDIIDKMVHIIASNFSLVDMADAISRIVGCDVKPQAHHHHDGDDQYTDECISIPWAFIAPDGRARGAVVAMLFMLITPLDMDVMDYDEDGPVHYIPDSLHFDGRMDVRHWRYGADIEGIDHPEYVLPGTIENPVFVPCLLAELVPFRW